MKIVITGGADGLGREIVGQLISHKHDVVLIDKTMENIEKVSYDLNIKDIFQCNLTEPSQIIETTQAILKKHKKIDVLINNAGVWTDENNESHLDNYKNMILVNMFGTIAVTKCFLPKFKKQKSGHIVNINSQTGINPCPNSPVYSATNHGIAGYRKSIAQELSQNGIKITDIYSGMIQTNLFAKAGVDFSKTTFDKYALSKEAVAKAVVWAIEQPADVAIPSLEIKNINETI
ncbi:MAG: SDR family NAD(P)-dependent oxidoreductase [Clostridia bacterium]|nr:SDR family NAD(P)-dependent oxidoreductase [Clostridia bacterium]